jgi:hypothetical protein
MRANFERRAWMPALAVLAATGALGACGGPGSDTAAAPDPREPAVIEGATAYRDAVAAGDAVKVCKLFSERKRLEVAKEADKVGYAGKLCVQAQKKELGDVAPLAAGDFTVEAVEFKGNHVAVADVLIGGEEGVWYFELEGGEWKFDGGGIASDE